MDYTKCAILRDLSYYDNVTIRDLQGLDGVIVRLGGSENDKNDPVLGNPYKDPKAMRFIQMAWDLDVPCLAYWFNGPRVYKEEQISEADLANKTDAQDPVMSALWAQMYSGTALRGINALFADYEEATYYCYKPWSVEDYWVTNVYMENLRVRFSKRQKTDPKLAKFPPIGMYSRRTFVDEHDNNPYSVQQYVIQHPEMDIWTANWPRKIPRNITIAELKAKWLPDPTWTAKSFGYSAQRAKTYRLWQFDRDPDYNAFNGTPEELREWCGYVPHGATPIEDIPPAYTGKVTVNVEGLRVRTVPSAASLDTVIETLHVGDPLIITGVVPDTLHPANLRGSTTINAYVAVKWNGSDYVVPAE